MDTLLLLARLFLAGMFLLSGIAKLHDLSGSRRAVSDFGVPERYARLAAIALPSAELLLAALLLPLPTAWWGGLGSLILLGTFIALMVYNLRQGRTPDCHCFGQLHSEPIGSWTVARNGIFAAIATFIVLFGWNDAGTSTVDWFQDLSSWERVLTVAALLIVAGIAVEAWMLLQLVRQNGRLLLRLDSLEHRLSTAGGSVTLEPEPINDEPAPEYGLPVGSPAPMFSLDSIYGETQTLDRLKEAGNPVVLIFTTPTCGPCAALMPDIGTWQREYAEQVTFAVIGQGELAANRAKSAEHGLANVLLQEASEVSSLYEVRGTPSAVLVNADGTIGSAIAPGVDAIRALVSSVIGSIPVRVPVTAEASLVTTSPANNGAPSHLVVQEARMQSDEIEVEVPLAPGISLPDLDGNIVGVESFAGVATVILFWNPGCGYCQRMLPELKSWEENGPPDAPRLLVVSTGTVEANRSQGFRSIVVLDESFGTGRAYGVSGTPSAVLVTSDGHLTGEPVVGGPQVLALLNGEELVEEAPGPPPVSLQLGEPAPEINLSDLDGAQVSLNDYRGEPTVVHFWNPGCVFCQRMVEDLRAWEDNPPPDAPRMLIVSSGDPQANRAADFRSTLVLDDGFAVGRAYGASGTPSGVLIDERGLVASDLQVGASKVLTLAKYVSTACRECLDACKEQGGGAACQSVCEMGGQCP